MSEAHTGFSHSFGHRTRGFTKALRIIIHWTLSTPSINRVSVEYVPFAIVTTQQASTPTTHLSTETSCLI